MIVSNFNFAWGNFPWEHAKTDILHFRKVRHLPVETEYPYFKHLKFRSVLGHLVSPLARILHGFIHHFHQQVYETQFSHRSCDTVSRHSLSSLFLSLLSCAHWLAVANLKRPRQNHLYTLHRTRVGVNEVGFKHFAYCYYRRIKIIPFHMKRI